MYIITHRIKTPSEFMDRFLSDGPAGGFFLEQKVGMPQGARICLELFLDWIDEVYFVYAQVERTHVQWQNCGRVERGAVVRLEDHEAGVCAEIVEKVRNSAESIRTRGADRQPLRVPVHYFDARRRGRDGEVLDLSPTGAYIRTRRPLATGSDVHLRFEDRETRVMRHLRGRVVRLDFSGPVAGMGVAFHFTNRGERRSITRLCKLLAA